MTFIELALVIAVLSTLLMLGAPTYFRARNKAMNVRAIADVSAIQRDIAGFQADRDRLPATLAEMGVVPRDPWGNAYQYLNFEDAKNRGKMRKDRFLVPINSTYDLYSMGADGKTATPLTAKASRDDIVRASDGAFIGLAVDF
jgi:general secretion pathway protein G